MERQWRFWVKCMQRTVAAQLVVYGMFLVSLYNMLSSRNCEGAAVVTLGVGGVVVGITSIVGARRMTRTYSSILRIGAEESAILKALRESEQHDRIGFTPLFVAQCFCLLWGLSIVAMVICKHSYWLRHLLN